MKPLTGLKILDFSTLLPGPWATEQLRQMGAQVTRIEPPNHPDLLRAYPNAYRQINGRKETITLDLKSAKAIETVHEFLSESDIVLEQFRPGVMRRLGLDYEQLQETYPRLIYCSLTGYGQHGDLSHKAGHDINYQALSGLASYNGSDRPVPTALQIGDIAGGSYPAMVGLLAAVIERHSTGRGQYIDVSMLNGSLALNTMSAPDALNENINPKPAANLLNGGTFYDYYQCACGGWIAFGGLEPKFYSAFCRELEREDLIAKFSQFSASHQTELKQELSSIFARKSQAQWCEALSDDCCVEPVLNVSDAFKSTLNSEYSMVEQESDGFKRIQQPIQFKARQS